MDSGFKKEDLFNFINFIVTFFLFFYITLSTNNILNLSKLSETTENEKIYFNMINKLSTGILDGTHGILLFDGVYSLILSAIYLANNNASIFQYHYFIFSPILMNKFYYFTLIYFRISFSESKKKFDLISGSTLISIYLFIWDFIISLIRDSSDLNKLYITQIVFASIPSLFVAIILIALIVFIFQFLFTREYIYAFGTLFCICSFLVCCGGFWIHKINDINYGDCDCCCDGCCDCYCCIECFDGCCCEDCICYISRCYCCDACCRCYDYFGCCDFFFCCGGECYCCGCLDD